MNPESVTIAERAADAEAAHEAAQAEVAAAALAAERGEEGSAAKLAAAEKRAAVAAAALRRARLAGGELERETERKREAEERAAKLAVLDEYEAARNFVRDASVRMFDLVASMEAPVNEARERAKAARALANELGLPVIGGGAFYPELGAVREAFAAVMGDFGPQRQRMLDAARAKVLRDWRAGLEGERVRELRAALADKG